MDSPGNNPNDPLAPSTTVRERVGAPTYVAPATHLTTHENQDDLLVPRKNRVQWGPIIAGLISALTIFLLLTVLGLGIGASVLDPNNADGGEVGTWAAIWGAITAILAFFVGGWVAAKTAAVGGEFGGLMNGLMVGAAGLVLIVYLTSTGLGNLFGTLSSNVGDIINVAGDVAQEQGVSPEEAQEQATDVAAQAQEAVEQVDPNAAFEAVRNGAIGTFLGMLLPLVAAGLGGYLGHNTRYDVTTGTG